jgi:dTDP-4-amino-4,6-dideoxygalactose transaminase
MGAKKVFSIPLTNVAPLPPQSFENAQRVMESGQLFRYGETNPDGQYVSKFESAFAAYHGKKYAIGVNSGGGAINLALRSAGVSSDDTVLLNAFTLAPVPGSLANIGCAIELVEITEDLVVDLDHLQSQIDAFRPKAFLLSHMRGHFGFMDEIAKICHDSGVLLIEDCAHTLGASYDGVLLGTYGVAGCFSLQTYKQINAGEGGVVLTDDDHLAAKAILMSGSYELHQQNGCLPPIEVFSVHSPSTPNFSMRLNELAAAIALPQLENLEERNENWRGIYRSIETKLNGISGLRFPAHHSKVKLTPTSIQFFVSLPFEAIQGFLKRCSDRGVKIKWFGAKTPRGFTSVHSHWTYIEPQSLSRTNQTLSTLCDLRLPGTLVEEDCQLICDIIREEFSSSEP